MNNNYNLDRPEGAGGRPATTQNNHNIQDDQSAFYEPPVVNNTSDANAQEKSRLAK